MRELARMSADPRALIERPESVTFAAHAETWLRDVVDPTLARTTAHSYRYTFDRYVKPHLGGLLLSSVVPAHIQRLVSTLTAAEVGARTVQLSLQVVRSILKNAAELGLVNRNAAEHTKAPTSKRKDIVFHTADEARAVLAKADESATRFRLALYSLAYDSGARPGELVAVHWPDLTFTDAGVRWRVRRNLTEVKGKLQIEDHTKTAKGIRVLDLSPATADALRAHRREMAADGRDVTGGLVFVDRDGGPLRKSNLLRRVHDPLMTAAGVTRITPHGTRHTMVTLLLSTKTPPHVVAARAGEDVEVLMRRYAHLLPGQQIEAAEALAKVLGPDSLQSSRLSNGQVRTTTDAINPLSRGRGQ